MEKFNAAEYISSLGNFDFSPSLERMGKVMQLLGNPQNKFPSIHVAGTNGKGSVVAMTAEALKIAGKKVGKFISPHIVDFRERIQINGEFISEEDLNNYSKRIKDTNIALNKFEFITAAAFLYFAESGIDVAVIETGLGGRLDATNILNNVRVSAITKIGLDHTEILGDTEEKIAKEKCGIIKQGITVTSPYQKPEVLSVIKGFDKNAVIPDISNLKVISASASGNVFEYGGFTFKTGMAGEFQIENALVAIEILKNCGFELSKNDIASGIEKGFMPARLNVVSKQPLIVVDGAHNPDGAAQLAGFMKNYGDITAVVGVMRDKDYKEVLKQTLPFAKRVICVTANSTERALPAKELFESAKKYAKDITVCEDLPLLIKELKAQSDTVFIYGSLYLAVNVLKLFD